MVSRDNTQINRTFNEDSYCKDIDSSKIIAVTENHVQRKNYNDPHFISRVKQHPMISCLEKKRMSTEQLIEVSPGS